METLENSKNSLSFLRSRNEVLPAGQKGSVIFIVVIMLAILSMIPVSLQLLNMSNAETQEQRMYNAQANNVARAGLEDAIMWFKRQAIQPVRSEGYTSLYSYPDAAFYPRQSVVAITSDTINEQIGLVKEYPLTNSAMTNSSTLFKNNSNLWARYEVKRQTCAWDGNSNLYDPHAVHDLSESRGLGTAGQGRAWYIECTGYVYRRTNFKVGLSSAPNQLVAKTIAQTEILSLDYNLPEPKSALVVQDIAKIFQNTTPGQSNSLILGGNEAGVAIYSAPTSPFPTYITGKVGAEVAAVTNGVWPPRIQDVLGVTESQLKKLADMAATQPSDTKPYPSMAIVYAEAPTMTFDNTYPLSGGGLLYVKGNLSVNCNTTFAGVIFVDGSVTINDYFNLRGCMIVTGTVNFNNNVGYTQLLYDENTVQAVRRQIAQYRENRGKFYAYSAYKS